MFLLFCILTLTAPLGLSGLRAMKVRHYWNVVDFTYSSENARQNAIATGQFIPLQNILNGLAVWKDNEEVTYFVSISKSGPGCPVTLATVTNQTRNGTTLLKPYPDWSWQGSCDGLYSVYRHWVDERDRLWVLDSGVYQDTQHICPPKLVIFELKTGKVLRIYVFPEEVVSCNSNFVTIIVDCRDGDCSNPFAYIADVGSFKMVAYNFKENNSWAITNDNMYPNPNYGKFPISGVGVDFMDGMLAIALGPVINYDRILYYHAFSSLQECWVKTSVIRNGSMFANNTGAAPEQFHIFKEERKSQSSLQDMTASGILFFALPVESTINCWNSKYPYHTKYMHPVEQIPDYVTDLKVVKCKKCEPSICVLTNTLQDAVNNMLSANKINYRIICGEVKDLVKNTKCDPLWKPNCKNNKIP